MIPKDDKKTSAHKRHRQSQAGVSITSPISWQQEKELLLLLSNDITQVRNKDDLVRVFSTRLKEYFTFTHSVISLIDNNGDTYYPFLIDQASMQIRNRKELPRLLKMHFPHGDAFIRQLPDNLISHAFLLEKISDMEDVPAFIRVNIECGIRKAMITRLNHSGHTIGYVFLYAENETDLTDSLCDIMSSIAPPLANAVVNIILNEQAAQLEDEKTALLTLSKLIAGMKRRDDLVNLVGDQIKEFFDIREFGLACVLEGGRSYAAFGIDVTDRFTNLGGFQDIVGHHYATNDPLFSRVARSEVPLSFDVEKLTSLPGMPAYVNLWKTAGVKTVVIMRLVAGNDIIGAAFVHVDEEKPSDRTLRLFQGICAHLAVAVSNILAHEKLVKINEEQAFLIDFNTNIARVRSVADLEKCIVEVLEKTMKIKLGMIQLLEDDQYNLRPFMYDHTLYERTNSISFFKKMAAEKVTVKEHYTAMVLASEEGLVFNASEEAKTGNQYARLWMATGYKNMYALPLRTGKKNIGTIWLHANQLSGRMLQGIISEISIAIDNILANEKLLNYKKQLEVENNYLKEQIRTIYDFSEIIGSGEAMQHVFNLISLVAETNSTVLLTGETGTGKELIARALHARSPRHNRVMVKLNCAALPANLIESELFGHEKGAFTGAIDKRLGKFELADKGTLFLDEVGEMPLETQVKLLRVLQEQEIERVGGQSTIRIDVRIIAATNRKLEEEVKAGKFRADLYYRLNVFPIDLPPLRQRPEDIPALAQFFLEKYARNNGKNISGFSAFCIQKLQRYHWPGNVRELQHLIERTVLLTSNKTISDIELPADITRHDDTVHNLDSSLENFEKSHIIKILKKCNGKISGAGGAAATLHIPATTLHSKIKKLGISKAEYLA